jgi:hypothetical protein
VSVADEDTALFAWLHMVDKRVATGVKEGQIGQEYLDFRREIRTMLRGAEVVKLMWTIYM